MIGNTLFAILSWTSSLSLHTAFHKAKVKRSLHFDSNCLRVFSALMKVLYNLCFGSSSWYFIDRVTLSLSLSVAFHHPICLWPFILFALSFILSLIRLKWRPLQRQKFGHPPSCNLNVKRIKNRLYNKDEFEKALL